MGQHRSLGAARRGLPGIPQEGQPGVSRGRLKTEKYDDKGGDTKYFTKVVALNLQFLDKKDKDEPIMTVEEEAADYEL